jgi:hypothetical protein
MEGNMLKRVCLLMMSLVIMLMLNGTALAQEPVGPLHTDPTWQAWYWNNPGLAGAPVLNRSEADLNHHWGMGSPDPTISADGFSARWTRYIDVPPGVYRFTATSDDGMRVWVDGRLIIDQWYDHGAITASADRNLGTGHHLVVVEYYENRGDALANLSIAPAAAVIQNWRGEYFNNTSLNGAPALVRDDAQINFDWGTGSPAPGPIGVDRFSVRWTRNLNLPAGSYRFSMTVDDGGRLWVNNHLLIDAWRDQAPSTYTGDIYLPGGPIPIRMEYYENSAGAVARLKWAKSDSSGPGGPPPGANGWLGHYYPNRDLAGPPAMSRVDRELQFDWGNGAPAPGFPADNFSARWTRDIYFAAGTYDFSAWHDDGVRVWLDGGLIIDAWYDQAATTHSATRTLNAGTHRVQVDYYEHRDKASIAVWASLRGGAPPPPPGPGVEVLVDNSGPGFQWGGPTRGRKVGYEGIGGNLYWTYNSTSNPVNFGRWTPYLPAAGKYEVYVYIPGGYGNSTNVRYRILHDSWRHDRIVNQNWYGDQWVSLGIYRFNAANRGHEFVLVYDNTREPYATRTIAFDAIKFVPR